MPKIISYYPNLVGELARAKITRAELSAVLGISRSGMSLKMTGKSEFSLDQMERARDFLSEINKEEYELGYLFERDKRLI
jgi:transcriptional regulator with XRE-family HTH domain